MRTDAPHDDAARGDPGFVVIVAAARSGSTLLRVMLDAHSEIGCPPEASIPEMIDTVGRVWSTIDGEHAGEGTGNPLALNEIRIPTAANADRIDSESGPPELGPDAKNEVRRAASAPMRRYCERHGKRIYCDKSLDSSHHLEAVHQVFPETRYLLMFRHVMDTVASGLEASPWGFQDYGYSPFVQRSPDNFVGALVNYWLTQVDVALRWEEAHPELCHRLRYEDLVTAPEEKMAQVFGFLGVANEFSVLKTAFRKARFARLPGDHKVMFTSTVDAASIGRGKRVPVAMLSPPQLEAASSKLTALGYKPLTTAWNAEPLPRSGDGGVWGARLAALMRTARLSPSDGHDVAPGSFAVVAEDVAELRWVIDRETGTIWQGGGEFDSAVTGTAEDLALLLGGEVNPGVLLRSGRIRYVTGREAVSPAKIVHTIQSLLEVFNDARQ